MGSLSHPLARPRIGNRPTTFFSRLLGASKVKYAFAVGAENCTMFVGIFGNHEPSNGWNLEGAHDVAIAIGAAHEANVDGGAGGQSANVVWVHRADAQFPEAHVAAPVAARASADRTYVTRSGCELNAVGPNLVSS